MCDDPIASLPTGANEPLSLPALRRAQATHPQATDRLIGGLTGRVHDEAALLAMMGRAARLGVEVLVGVSWAGVTANIGGVPFTAAHTDLRVLVIDEGQYEEGDGPCLQAARSGRAVQMNQRELDATWPHLGAQARATGVGSVLAVPLWIGTESVGSFNLYGARCDSMADVDADLLAVLQACIGRGFSDYFAAQQDAGAVLDRLRQHAAIEQATGAIMAVHGLAADEARELLHEHSRTKVSPLASTAVDILRTLTRPATRPPGAAP